MDRQKLMFLEEPDTVRSCEAARLRVSASERTKSDINIRF